METVKKWLGDNVACDLCGKKPERFFVDGRCSQGGWATMCHDCFVQYGSGLGQGSGQKYDATTYEKLEG